MIVVEKSERSVSITGHAGYAEQGKDIVCAGVSTLVQTLIKSIETLTRDKIEYSLSAGKSVIKYRNLSESSKLLIDSFFVGIQMIAEEYPCYVKIISPK
ncbi:ribosomal-processing cysteine protease Prp [Massilioclostridium coli]|uniref:ribosomal-processing cysteine protease Prp n=1 Tax=Massilioclostridium coli TaxID=1870991 RepID=UPI00085C9208|nr:ribosomal-processing cysteine protease Prp [Massilioclostridium coli]